MKQYRKCEVEIKQEVNGRVETQRHQAMFHVWGYREIKGPPHKRAFENETVGICELKGGKVRLVRPEKIRFLDEV